MLRVFFTGRILTALLCLALFVALPEQTFSAEPMPAGSFADLATWQKSGFFPGIFFTDVLERAAAAKQASPYWVRSQAEQAALDRIVSDHASILLNNDILAFYGHPLSRNMGILGRYPIEELHRMLSELAEEYRRASGGREVKKAFYIIYGTVWPGGDIGYINQDVLRRWVEYALENDILVFIDHQIGRFDPVASLARMFPWLHYPNVHLALDPEWQTLTPMKEIGSTSADELNRAQRAMENYIIENDIPGERMLVIHQFHYKMISNRQDVRTDFRRVRLVHNASGFGSPGAKRSAYDFNARATNIPVKAFKLFYDFQIPGAGVDKPLMTPAEVYALRPRPFVIMYQ
ncbi:MAG: hypothetical protein FWD94_02245 [Treponema sp.]|nr:hypothetical protein [Treponema sp.]